MADESVNLHDVREQSWLSLLEDVLDEGVADDWYYIGCRKLVTVAATTPLRGLFPFRSHNSLHFSRCSDYPFTHDCPWIWFTAELLVTFAPDSRGRQGNVVFPLPRTLRESDDPRAAVDTAVQALPPYALTDVWLGTCHDRT